MRKLFLVVLTVTSIMGLPACRAQQTQGLKGGDEVYLRLVQTIPLDGVEGRIDHLSIDSQGGRIFLAALGNNSVEVVNLQTGERVKSIRGLKEPQGVSYLPDFKRLYVANGGDGAVKIFDGESLELLATVSLSGDADNVRYDREAGLVYVGFGDGGLAAIDPATTKLAGTVKLEAHPESFQLEKGGPLIYVNVPNKSQIAVIDRKKAALVGVWQVGGARANFPMGIDEADHFLFVGCRDPAKLLIYDTQQGKQIASVLIPGDADDVFYDAEKKLIYVSGGEGYIGVIKQVSRTEYESVARVVTAAGARTSLFVPELHRLYVVVPHRVEQKAALLVYEVQ